MDYEPISVIKSEVVSRGLSVRRIKSGEIVIFHSGYSENCLQPSDIGKACVSDPLKGKREGWPSLSPDTVLYLAQRGIRCVGTDGPRIGDADEKRALMTYWALASHGMVAVEYLTNIDQLSDRTYFLFAATKIANCHGGPGRAIAIF